MILAMTSKTETQPRMICSDEFSEVHEISIPSDPEIGQEIQEQIIARMEACQFTMRDVFCMRLALAEGFTNAIRHGNRMERSRSVDILWCLNSEKIRVVISDQGEGFNPEDLLDPTAEENLDRPGGRGIVLMKSFMDLVQYNDRGNQLTLEKIRSVE
jgi:serine/threonine-protein kinase RsbW